MLKQYYKYNCIDCNKKIERKSQKRCQPCFIDWAKSHSKEQSNYQDGHSISYCVDCKKRLRNNLDNRKRCWECYVQYRKNNPISEETRLKFSINAKKLWSNQEYKERTLKKIYKSFARPFNKAEQKLNNILKILFDKQYKFVGNSSFMIEEFNPDFINCNGQKKIIEMYGDYWHKQEEYIERDKRRLISYKKYGYKTLIVWEHELKDIDLLAGKLIIFHEDQ